MRRRRMGQHFLTDRAVIQRIISALALTPTDRVLEVGPGRGALTGPLLERAAELVAVELDEALAGRLPQLFPSARFRLVCDDMTRVDLETLVEAPCPGASRWRLVGNLPYSVASPIIARVLPRADLFSDVTIMIQKEVAQRLLAKPGSPDYGPLAVFASLHALSGRLVTNVRPGAFSPPPEVDSAVVHLALPPSPVAASVSAGAHLARQAFLHRRKQLANALPRYDRQQLTQALAHCGLPAGARPEEISPEQYVELASSLSPEGAV